MTVNLKKSYRDSPGGPMVKTPCFQCRGHWKPLVGGSIPGRGLGQKKKKSEREKVDFPGGSVVKNPPASADIVSISGLGRFRMSQSN